MQSIEHLRTTLERLRTIPDDELLRRLAALVDGSRRTEADLVAHIGEVDARGLYAVEATPSMFAYCLERLHLSEREAYLRIAAARASREHPVILDMLSDGRLHLTGIALLAPHLTPENRDVLLARATHKTKREIEELVAELAPRPDAQASIRRLPVGRRVTSTRPLQRVTEVATVGAPVPAARLDALGTDRRVVDAASGAATPTGRPPAMTGLRPEQVDSTGLDGLVLRASSEPAAKGLHEPESLPEREKTPSGRAADEVPLRWAARRDFPPARIEPLSPARYRVQFTASAELRGKIERLRALMRSTVPDGDLAAIIDAAVTEKLERLEARRFGLTRAPRKQSRGEQPTDKGTPTPPCGSAPRARPTSRHVPAAVRRAVHERDEARCRYTDAQGRRCTARALLEFHHRRPFAVGGEHSTTNVSMLCEVHNRLLARMDFGAKAVDRGRCASAGVGSAGRVAT